MATPIDTMMDGVDWEEVSDMTPGFHDGRRIFDAEDIERLLGTQLE